MVTALPPLIFSSSDIGTKADLPYHAPSPVQCKYQTPDGATSSMGTRLERGCLVGACGLCGLLLTPTATAAPPDPAAAVDAWMQTRGLIDGEPAYTAETTPAGIHLILRLERKPIASTWAATAAGHVDPVSEASAALLERAKLHPTLRGTPSPFLETGLKRATLEAETSGEFWPLTGRSFESIAQGLDPAASGLALRVGKQWHVRFPSALRMTGSAATLSTLHELAAVAGLTPAELLEARRHGTATLYRFETIDLVQLEGERTPRAFSRGNMQEPWMCNRASVLQLMEEVATHLKAHDQIGLDGASTIRLLGGDYLPHADRFVPPDAAPRDKAGYRWSMAIVADTPGIEPSLANAARGLQQIPLGTSDTAADEIVSSAIRIALIAEPSRNDLTRAIESVANEEARPADRAIAAWALAGHNPLHPVLDAFLEEVASWPPSEVIATLPWMYWADLRVATAKEDHAGMTDVWIAIARRALAAMREATIPTADFLPLATLIASLAGDDSVIPPEARPEFVDGVCEALAMLRRLVVTEDEARFYRGSAQGGVRLTSWDERMPIQAQSMAILMLREALNVVPATLQGEEQAP